MIYEVDAVEAKFVGHCNIADYCQDGYGEEVTLLVKLLTITDSIYYELKVSLKKMYGRVTQSYLFIENLF